MAKSIQIVKVDNYESPKCDLSNEEFEQYLNEREQLYDDLEYLCFHFAKLRKYEDDHNIRWNEDKATVAKVFCLALQMTSAAGKSNPLSEMRYEKLDNGDEVVISVLADGDDEWYRCHVSGDSGIAMIKDMVNQFVRKAW